MTESIPERWLRRYTNNVNAWWISAEDLYQEGAVAMWQAAPGYRETGKSLDNYLIYKARNRILTVLSTGRTTGHLRIAHPGKGKANSRLADSESTRDPHLLSYYDKGYDHDYASVEIRRDIMKAIGKLPLSSQRRIFKRYWEWGANAHPLNGRWWTEAKAVLKEELGHLKEYVC